jgi:hypothetical protein
VIILVNASMWWRTSRCQPLVQLNYAVYQFRGCIRANADDPHARRSLRRSLRRTLHHRRWQLRKQLLS